MRAYAIIRSTRTKTGLSETVERSGLTYAAAVSEQGKLQETERKSKPDQTSWTYDIFSIRFEGELQC